jgi:K+-transporting ATPase ATPase A chain
VNLDAWPQVIVFFFGLLVVAKPLGTFIAGVFQGERTFLAPVLGPIERLIYRLSGVHPDADTDWKQYAKALLLFNLIGALFLYALQRLQAQLPLNPAGVGAVSPDSSFNTAISFVTNTNWQGYSGESTMSYLTQMLGLAVQNFLSAATGLAALAALIRGFTRHTTDGIGNFWSDLVRSTLYILLPLSFVLALVLVSQGVVQSFKPYQRVALVEPTSSERPKLDSSGNPLRDAGGKPLTESVAVREQVLPLGPVASQEAIKELGTNGGGFFNANSSHPFENPTPLTNFLEMLAMLLIPAALCYAFGKMVGDTRQGWAILAAMTLVFAVMFLLTLWSEYGSNPALQRLGVDQTVSQFEPGGNMEGKEVRFGVVDSVLWATVTTATSCGAVNGMHDSYMPLGGLVLMWLIQLGEVIFGGVGSGLYTMLVFVIIAVFVAGLIVGRTPEYLGKKIEAFEMKMAALIVLIPVFAILVGTAVAVMSKGGTATVFNPGAHGFSEILYAFSSATGNNGSAFAGLGANTLFYNTALGIAMFIGRFWMVIPTLAIAASLALKKKVPPSAGTLPTHTPLFIVWLIAVVIMVGALSFLPALALGPIVEHLMLHG